VRLFVAPWPTGPPLARLRDASEPRVAFEEKLAGVQGFGLQRFTVGREESPMTDFAAEPSNEPD
jgi:hypothetical protein